MARKQKVGLERSATRTLLLDSAEELMREEGYAAVTSRRLGAKAGVKPQLVHYYFPTMDDLFVSMYRRSVERGLRLAADALASQNPLRTIWQQSCDPVDVTLRMEFMALGNHRKLLRAEMSIAAETFRDMQRQALTRYFDELDVHPPIPLDAMILLLAGVGWQIEMRAQSGMMGGNAETKALIEAVLVSVEDSGGETRNLAAAIAKL